MKFYLFILLDRLLKYRVICVSTFFVFLFLVPTPSFTQDESGSFYHDGELRKYDVYFPDDIKPNLPVILVLHGYTYPPWKMAEYTRMHELADTLGFIVVYPEGSRWGDVGWNNGLRDHPFGLQDTTADDVGFLVNLIDTLYAHYSIDLNRVYCCGWSMGGGMTYRMAIEQGNRFKAFASVAGKVNDIIASYAPDSSYPILHIHGTADPVELWGWGYGNQWSVDATVDYWVTYNYCSSPPDIVALPDLDPTDLSTVEKITWSDCASNTQIQFYKVTGGGHSWPGHTKGMNPGGAPRNNDIKASVEILKFFKYYEPVFALGAGTFTFDSISIGCYQMDTLVVRNDGHHPLNITNAVSDNPFITVEPESTTIPSVDSAFFVITSTPLNEGPYSSRFARHRSCEWYGDWRRSCDGSYHRGRRLANDITRSCTHCHTG